MSNLRFLVRTMWHFRLVNTGVILSVAVCSMVLTGAVIVGDSVSDSLRGIVEKRLGDIDHILVAPRLFSDSLAKRMETLPSFQEAFTKAQSFLKTSGTCLEPASNAIAAQVNVFGADFIQPGTCVVSRRLARQLAVAEHAAIVLRMDPMQYASAALPVGRDRTDIAMLRLKVAGVAEEGAFQDAFEIHGTQRPVKNVWVPLADLQQALDVPAAANVLSVSAKPRHKDKDAADRLQAMLAGAVTLDDYGLFFRKSPAGDLVLESKELLFPHAVEEAIQRLSPAPVGVLAYVIDTMRNVRNGRECPYALAAGLSRLPDGAIPDGAVVLNSWAADDLGAKSGDRLVLSFFAREPGGLPVKQSAEFTVDRIIRTAGIGADRTLVPDYKMITGAESIADWVPPRDFEFHAERIRRIDEDYWDRFRASPRAFISLDTAQKIWQTGYGSLSSVRFTGVTEEQVSRALLQVLTPSSAGLVFRPIRQEQLRSASGNTDFAQLFLGLGSFLVASSVLLVALVILLLVEQRSRQVGMMFAMGFTARRIRGYLLAEGLILLVIGGVLGAVSSLGYAWLVLEGLKTLWTDAVGTRLLRLSVRIPSIAVSLPVSLAVCAAAVWWGVARVGRISIAAAVSGKKSIDEWSPPSGSKRLPILTVGLLIVAVAALAGVLVGLWNSTVGFYAAGACFLASSLHVLYRWFVHTRGFRQAAPEGAGLIRMGTRSAARRSTRSMLTAGLLASASFIVVAVSAMKSQGPTPEDQGGLALVTAFDIPLPYDLNTRRGRDYLGLPDAELWRSARFVNMLSTSGDDVSCRNLYRASNPRITSVPEDFVRQGGFRFASAVSKVPNPWDLLDMKPGDGSIPAIADCESARWTMHKRLGDTIAVTDEQGAERRLRIVALLRKSIFQAELLVSEANFRTLFPTRSGFGQVLVAVQPEHASAMKDTLARGLADFGITVETVEERLASFAGIAAAYISAFQALGGLGILLGSLGLVVVLIRGIAERRGEIALLYALGFSRRSVVLLLTVENGFLLVLGMLAGTVAALLAVAPEGVGGAIHPGSILSAIAFLSIIGAVIILSLVWVSAGLVRKISPDALRPE